MNNSRVSGFKVFGLTALIILLLAGGANAATLTVNANGGANYTKIQDAINAASAGDTILVYSGTYYENVNVNRQLTLRGIGQPVVDARGIGSAITLAANGITLEGFTATLSGGSNDAGIKVISNNNKLSGNNASNNRDGIYLYSSNNTLIDNNVSSNSAGIFLSSSSNNTLIGNNVSNNDYGIFLSLSSHNTLIGNNVSHSSSGIYMSSSSDNNMLSGNNVNSNNGGITMYYSSSNTLIANIASNNKYDGIYVEDSNSNQLRDNIVNSNGRYGIYMTFFSQTMIYNNILSNNKNFYFSGSNIDTWNTTKTLGMNIIGGSYLGGNVWANPSGTGFSQTCSDANNDGVCDSPYTLDANNIDYLPLAQTSTVTPPTYSPTPTVTPLIAPTITPTSTPLPTVIPLITPTQTATVITTPTPSKESQLEQEVKELKERLNKTEEKQIQQESRISWLESTINSIIDWFKRLF